MRKYYVSASGNVHGLMLNASEKFLWSTMITLDICIVEENVILVMVYVHG